MGTLGRAPREGKLWMDLQTSARRGGEEKERERERAFNLRAPAQGWS